MLEKPQKVIDPSLKRLALDKLMSAIHERKQSVRAKIKARKKKEEAITLAIAAGEDPFAARERISEIMERVERQEFFRLKQKER